MANRRMVSLLAKSLVVLVAAASLLQALNAASEPWIRVTTPHFEIITSGDAGDALDAARTFEETRAFFLAAGIVRQLPESQVRIIAFSSENEFAKYRTTEGVIGYYQNSRDQNYIVLQDLEPGFQQVAVHEYTHFILSQTEMRIPAWLNEGLAQVYSSLEVHHVRAVAGRPPWKQMMVLSSQRWLGLSALTSTAVTSIRDNGLDDARLFYAESWALAHMLFSQSEYRSRFAQFLTHLASGQTAEESFGVTYGKTLVDVAIDLRKHVELCRTGLQPTFEVKLPALNFTAQIHDLPAVESDLMLANLLASHQSTAREARERLSIIASDHPENAQAEESLGYLAWRLGKLQEARLHFRRAVEKGSNNSAIFRDLMMPVDRSDRPLP